MFFQTRKVLGLERSHSGRQLPEPLPLSCRIRLRGEEFVDNQKNGQSPSSSLFRTTSAKASTINVFTFA